jgi:hypothetical protein
VWWDGGVLGEVLERLFGDDRAVAVHAVVDEVRDAVLADEAMKRAMAKAPAMRDFPLAVRLSTVPGLVTGLKYRRRPPGPAGPTGRSQLELWLDARGRVRLERRWEVDGASERLVTLTAVNEGLRGWTDLDRSHDLIRDVPLRPGGRWPAPMAGDAECVFRPAQIRKIAGALVLTEVGDAVVAGRAVVEVVARERDGRLWPHWLPPGADEYLLAFDVEHGHLLRTAARSGGREFGIREVVSVAYGDDIPATIFAGP